MTDGRHPTPGCVDAETLAAFIDDRLEPRERAAVEAHLAECEDCYEVWMGAVASGTGPTEAGLAPIAVPKRPWRPSRTMLALTGVAAAIAVAVASSLWLKPERRIERAVGNLVKAVGTQRFAEARLSEAFPWNRIPSELRGPSDAADVAVQIAALKLREVAALSPNSVGHRGIGLSYLVMGDADAAIASFERAVLIDPTFVPARLDLSAALFERWKAVRRAEDIGRVLEQTGAVLAVHPTSATALFNQALAWTSMNVPPQAIEAWQAFLRVEETGPWADEARLHITELERRGRPPLGAVPNAADEVDADRPFSIYTYVEGTVLPEWARAPNTPATHVMLETALVHARALASQGRDAYVAELVSAAEASARWPAVRRQALVSGIGALLDWRTMLDSGDYRNAETRATAALEFLNAAGVDAAEAELEVAYSDLSSGRGVAAMTRLIPLEARAVKRGFLRIAARAGRLRALSAMLDTRVAEAQDRYQTALGLARRSGDIELESLLNTFLAESYGAHGDSSTAWTYLVAALTPFPHFVTQRQRFDALTTAASVARRTGMHEASLLFGTALLDTTREWTNPEGRIGAHLHIARALTQLARGDRGVDELRRAAALLPDLQTRPQAQARLKAELAFAHAFALAGQDDRAALRAADEAERFFGGAVRVRLAELLLQRGRIHARLGHFTQARTDWLRAIDIIEDQRPALRSEILRISRTASLWDVYLEAITHTRHDPTAALDLTDRAHARELMFTLGSEGSAHARQASVKDARALLTDGAIALVYAQLPEQLLVWAVTSRDIRLTERKVSAKTMERLVDAFVTTLDDGPASATARALAQELIPSGIALRPDRPLVIVPDGVLFRVPFAALPVPGLATTIVATSIPIVTPSLAAFAMSSQPAPRPENRRLLAIGVGDAVPRDGLGRLANAEGEAMAAAGEYRDKMILTNATATRAAILKELPQYDVIHFAGHAAVNSDFPMNSRLYVSGGVISASDISTLPLRLRTVAVLGACETARGPGFQGEGPLSFVRAFLAAGASNIVATLWRVRDGDAAALLVPLHKDLAAGRDPATGLARSQREMAARGMRPSTWSGFVVVGGINIERIK